MGYYLASITYVLVFLVQVNNYASEAKFSDIYRLLVLVRLLYHYNLYNKQYRNELLFIAA